MSNQIGIDRLHLFGHEAELQDALVTKLVLVAKGHPRFGQNSDWLVPNQAVGLLEINLTKQVIEYLTGVATDANCLGQHTPQTMIAKANRRSTLQT